MFLKLSIGTLKYGIVNKIYLEATMRVASLKECKQFIGNKRVSGIKVNYDKRSFELNSLRDLKELDTSLHSKIFKSRDR